MTADHAAVEQLLRRLLAKDLVVRKVEALGGDWAQVSRVTFTEDQPGFGGSVVVKRRRTGGEGWGYEPENLRREWAALQFLDSRVVHIAPHALCFDDAAGVLVMSDLGLLPTVEQLLHGSDASAAVEGLRLLGGAMGRMHVASLGRAQEFADFLAPLGLSNPDDGATPWPVPLWEETCAALDRLGLPSGDRAAGDVSAVERELAEPGGFAVLTHLDVQPQNVLVDGRTAWIVDFEGAAFRHLARDAAGLRFPFVNYGRWAAVPDEPRQQMELTYRGVIRDASGVLTDDATFDAVMALGCASWAILRIGPRLERISANSGDPRTDWRRRVQVVHTTEVFIRAASQAGRYPELVSWANDLVNAMRARWTEANDPPPVFPAFA